MSEPKIYCKLCGFLDDIDNFEKPYICVDCLRLYKDNVNFRWIKPSEKVWKMIEEDFRKKKLTIRQICNYYGISRNSLSVHFNKNKPIIKKTWFEKIKGWMNNGKLLLGYRRNRV